jgi:hypothetical protein
MANSDAAADLSVSHHRGNPAHRKFRGSKQVGTNVVWRVYAAPSAFAGETHRGDSMKQQLCIIVVSVFLSVMPLIAWSQQVTIGDLPALVPSTPVPGSQRAPADFNGDGHSDLAWTNPFTHQFGYWLMGTDGGSGKVKRLNAATFNVTDGYFIAAIGDFNGDGYADVAFTSAKRDLYLWLNNRGGGFVSQYLTTYPPDWQLLGAGDADGDGQDDLLWQYAGGCQVGVWFIRNGVRVGLRSQVVDCDYGVIALGYFTPSGRISILRSRDLYNIQILDSTTAGFVAYDVTPPVSGKSLIGIGGGVAGRGIVAEYRQAYPDGSYGTFGSYRMLDRSFDGEGHQTGFSWLETWSGYTSVPWGVGGALVASRGSIGASLIQNYGNGLIEACAPGQTGIPYGDCTRFGYPRGWFAVGAPVNGVGDFGAEMAP